LHSETTKARWAAAALLAIFAAACSSESLPEPEPELRHSGAFFAVGSQPMELYRMLKALRIEGDNILFTTLYDVAPANFEEATAIAQRAEIPVREQLLVFSEVQVLRSSVKVVWFRTLTAEEEKRAP
jgi:hypothetical protein